MSWPSGGPLTHPMTLLWHLLSLPSPPKERQGADQCREGAAVCSLGPTCYRGQDCHWEFVLHGFCFVYFCVLCFCHWAQRYCSFTVYTIEKQYVNTVFCHSSVFRYIESRAVGVNTQPLCTGEN